MKYWRYLKYVFRHKLFVFQEGIKLGVPLWQLVIHDWSKFLPDEFLPYAEWFYGCQGKSWYTAPDTLESEPCLPDTGYQIIPNRAKVDRKTDFDRAWLKHQHRNPHHWQHWILQEDSGKIEILEMPRRYQLEMLADWRGAGRAINGKDDTADWYKRTTQGRRLHPYVQSWIETELNIN